MQRLKSSLLFAVVAVALAQTPATPPAADDANAVENPSSDVIRVGKHLKCKCGCADSVATCQMLGCEYSKPGKQKIAKLQALGMSDDEIIKAFVQEYGPDIYLAPPSAFGWIVPYASVGVGLVGIWMFLKKYRKPKPLPEVGTIEIDDPALEKYKDQIEKDLANMD